VLEEGTTRAASDVEDCMMGRTWQKIALCLLLAAVVPLQAGRNEENPMGNGGTTEYATLGGGCFWCLEAVFERIEGVRSVVSGYAGGTLANPTYDQVCTGTTGHAEVVRIEFDPAVLSYDSLLEIFWDAHDPTTMDRQGADVGTQYRSIILYQNERQRVAAERSRDHAASRFDSPIVTEIVPLKAFYEAEPYHQDYFRNNPNAPYCLFVIKPKLKKLGH
jgi:peptide-methionine (S)-S-oxide reductase